MAPIITAMIVTTLFLGGTKGFEPIPGQVWFIAKTFAVVFALLWVRATWPRLRVDQIMGFAWKGLFALSLINIFVVAIQVVALQDADGGLSAMDLWVMSAVNWAIAIVAVVALAKALGQRRLERPAPKPSPLANMYAEAD